MTPTPTVCGQPPCDVGTLDYIRQSIISITWCTVIYSMTHLRSRQGPTNGFLLNVQYSQVPFKCGPIYHVITYGIVITVTKSEWDFRITTETHISPSQVSYGVSVIGILEKIDCIKTALCCILNYNKASPFWGEDKTINTMFIINLKITNNPHFKKQIVMLTTKLKRILLMIQY